MKETVGDAGAVITRQDSGSTDSQRIRQDRNRHSRQHQDDETHHAICFVPGFRSREIRIDHCERHQRHQRSNSATGFDYRQLFGCVAPSGISSITLPWRSTGMLKKDIAATAHREANSCRGKATRLKMICGIGIASASSIKGTAATRSKRNRRSKLRCWPTSSPVKPVEQRALLRRCRPKARALMRRCRMLPATT